MRGPIADQQDQTERDRSRYEEDPNRPLTNIERAFDSSMKEAFAIADESKRAAAFSEIFKLMGGKEKIVWPKGFGFARFRKQAEFQNES